MKERLDLEVGEIAGGHLVALTRPSQLAERLDASAVFVPALDPPTQDVARL